jgi:hypothetical protein
MNDNYFTNLKYWQKLSGEQAENLNVIYGGDTDLKTSNGNYISWKSIQQIKANRKPGEPSSTGFLV